MESWGSPQRNPDRASSAPTNSRPRPLGRAPYGAQNSKPTTEYGTGVISMGTTLAQVHVDLPILKGPLPGPRAQEIIERDTKVVSPSYTRSYPLVAAKGEGSIIEDVDGNRFLDLTAGIAVVATGHCHPKVVAAIQEQAARLIHMSGTDFYYEELAVLAEKLSEIAPGDVARRISFGNS